MKSSLDVDKLYDIYEMWHVPFWQTTLFCVILGGCVAAVAIVALYKIYNAYRGSNKPRPAWEQALKDLGKLANLEITDKRQAKQFYFLLTSIIKKYLSRRYSLMITGKTDRELIELIEKKELPADVFLKARSIFMGCSLIKYADEKCLNDQCKEDLDRAIMLVERSSLDLPSQKKEAKY